MRLLFIGDVVGRSGRAAILEQVPVLRSRWGLDFVIVNGENAAGGFGLTEAIFEEFLRRRRRCGDARQSRLRPARGAGVHRAPAAPDPARQLSRRHAGPGRVGDREREGRAAPGRQCARAHLHGRARRSFRRRRARARPPVRWAKAATPRSIDMHAEATSEKWALGHFADGRASLIVGTHTHVPSADHRILAGGTGFITDVGMTGDYDSVIGMEKDEPLRRFTRRIPPAGSSRRWGRRRFAASRPRSGPTASTKAIAPVRIGGLLSAAAARTSGAEPMMTAPTIVYDLDGTLADTAGDLMAAPQRRAWDEGLAPLPVESAGSLLGAGGRALIQRGFAASGRDARPAKARGAVRRLLESLQRPYRRSHRALSRRRRSARGVRARRLAAGGLHQQDGGFGEASHREARRSRIGSPSSAARTRSESASPTRSRCSETIAASGGD